MHIINHCILQCRQLIYLKYVMLHDLIIFLLNKIRKKWSGVEEQTK